MQYDGGSRLVLDRVGTLAASPETPLQQEVTEVVRWLVSYHYLLRRGPLGGILVQPTWETTYRKELAYRTHRRATVR